MAATTETAEKIAAAIGDVSTFSRITDTVPVVKHLSVAMLQHRIRREKDGPLFSPSIFNGTRGNAAFVTASALCMDFDKGNPTPTQILAIFPGTLAWLYSTHTHTAEKPRYRAVFPLSRPVNAAEHLSLGKGVLEVLPHDLGSCLDESCLERARAHYLPSCRPEQKDQAVLIFQDGDALAVDPLVELGQETPTVDEVKRGTHADRDGTRPGDDYIRRHTIEDVLRECEWQHVRGDKWLRPFCDTDSEHSAKVYQGGVYVYSSSAPVPIGYHDAFSLYAYTYHGGDFTVAAKALAAEGYGEPGPREERAGINGCDHPIANIPPRLFVSAKEMLSRDVKINWRIKGFIECGTTGQEFGPSGHGKTFIATDMAMSIAAGTDWNGHPCEQGAVLYFAGEGQGGISRRIKAWHKHHGEPDLSLLYVSRGIIDFTEAGINTAIAEGRNLTQGKSVALVVIDTLARHLQGDENSTKDMSTFIKAVDDLREAFPGCVALIVHHSGHGEETKTRARGSSALRAAMDFEIQCNDGLLTFTKMKDAEAPEPIPFKLLPVEIGIDEDGEPLTSCVVEYGERAAKHLQKPLTKREQELLTIVEENTDKLCGDIREVFIKRRMALNPETKRDYAAKAYSRSLEGLLAKDRVYLEDNYVKPGHRTKTGHLPDMSRWTDEETRTDTDTLLKECPIVRPCPSPEILALDAEDLFL